MDQTVRLAKRTPTRVTTLWKMAAGNQVEMKYGMFYLNTNCLGAGDCLTRGLVDLSISLALRTQHTLLV